MNEIELVDWFVVCEADDFFFCGRSMRGLHGRHGPIIKIEMVERVDQWSFISKDGSQVKLIGKQDNQEAERTGGNAELIHSFEDGIPPAFQMLRVYAQALPRPYKTTAVNCRPDEPEQEEDVEMQEHEKEREMADDERVEELAAGCAVDDDRRSDEQTDEEEDDEDISMVQQLLPRVLEPPTQLLLSPPISDARSRTSSPDPASLSGVPTMDSTQPSTATFIAPAIPSLVPRPLVDYSSSPNLSQSSLVADSTTDAPRSDDSLHLTLPPSSLARTASLCSVEGERSKESSMEAVNPDPEPILAVPAVTFTRSSSSADELDAGNLLRSGSPMTNTDEDGLRTPLGSSSSVEIIEFHAHTARQPSPAAHLDGISEPLVGGSLFKESDGSECKIVGQVDRMSETESDIENNYNDNEDQIPPSPPPELPPSMSPYLDDSRPVSDAPSRSRSPASASSITFDAPVYSDSTRNAPSTFERISSQGEDVEGTMEDDEEVDLSDELIDFVDADTNGLGTTAPITSFSRGHSDKEPSLNRPTAPAARPSSMRREHATSAGEMETARNEFDSDRRRDRSISDIEADDVDEDTHVEIAPFDDDNNSSDGAERIEYRCTLKVDLEEAVIDDQDGADYGEDGFDDDDVYAFNAVASTSKHIHFSNIETAFSASVSVPFEPIASALSSSSSSSSSARRSVSAQLEEQQQKMEQEVQMEEEPEAELPVNETVILRSPIVHRSAFPDPTLRPFSLSPVQRVLPQVNSRPPILPRVASVAPIARGRSISKEVNVEGVDKSDTVVVHSVEVGDVTGDQQDGEEGSDEEIVLLRQKNDVDRVEEEDGTVESVDGENSESIEASNDGGKEEIAIHADDGSEQALVDDAMDQDEEPAAETVDEDLGEEMSDVDAVDDHHIDDEVMLSVGHDIAVEEKESEVENIENEGIVEDDVESHEGIEDDDDVDEPEDHAVGSFLEEEQVEVEKEEVEQEEDEESDPQPILAKRPRSSTHSKPKRRSIVYTTSKSSSHLLPSRFTASASAKSTPIRPATTRITAEASFARATPSTSHSTPRTLNARASESSGSIISSGRPKRERRDAKNWWQLDQGITSAIKKRRADENRVKSEEVAEEEVNEPVIDHAVVQDEEMESDESESIVSSTKPRKAKKVTPAKRRRRSMIVNSDEEVDDDGGAVMKREDNHISMVNMASKKQKKVRRSGRS